MTTKHNIIISFRLFIFLLAVALPIRLQSQQIDISIRTFPSSWYNSRFEPEFGGAGIGVAYHPLLNKLTRLNISGEFAVLRERNEVLLGFGINKTFIQAERFRVSIEANALSGVDLFKPAPLWVGGLEAGVRFDYYIMKRVSLFAGLSARVTMVPGYRDIGVWKHSSWPLVLGVRF
jgi:hypothetical protein